MILAIDIGNSNIVVGGVEGNTVVFEARLQTDAAKSGEAYCADLEAILENQGVGLDHIEGAIIGSVVPQVQISLQTAVNMLTGKAALVVGPELKTGLTIRIDDPTEIGADLVLGAVAALREHKPPIIMVDMGTATTVMVLDRDGAFIGGAIAPGVKISLDALTDRTALLPDMQLDPPEKAIGSNTIDCMKSGIMMGAACMLDGMIERMEAELGEKATVVATGGIARFVIPMCKRTMIYDRDLLVKGLVALYRENQRH